MRILYLTNGFPFPLTSGYLRHYHFIRGLAGQHQITLLSVVGPSFTVEHAEALRPYTGRVLTFSARGRGRTAWRKAIAGARAWLGHDGAEGEMRAAVQGLLERERFDAVYFSGKATFAAIDGLLTPPVVADFTDAASMRIRLQARYAQPVKVPVLWIRYRQMRRLERQILHRAAHALFVSARDRDAVRGRSNTPGTIVPVGVDLDYWARSSAALGQHTIIFTGAMNYAPNADAALYLIREVLPLVKRQVADAQLLIVGHSPRPDLRAAGQQPGVTVTGFVEDVRSYLERATLFAAPLRFGAGVQNKLLEAMAMQVPVIASPLAADGLRTEAGDVPPIQVARTAQEFAAIAVRELRARAASPAPDAAARRYVAEHFVWERSVEAVDRILRAVAGAS